MDEFFFFLVHINTPQIILINVRVSIIMQQLVSKQLIQVFGNDKHKV